LCAASPCTLGRLSEAVHRADNDPKLVLWLELLTVSHITGRRTPEPDPGWIALLRRSFDEQTLECAVAHRIQAAVDARYAGIAEYNAPGEFIAHLAASAWRTLNGEPPGCAFPEVRWQAGTYRWFDVKRALKPRGGPDDEPHPATESWAARGLVLDGRTRAEQLTELLDRPDCWRDDDATVIGTVRPSLIDVAARKLSARKAAGERLLHAAGFLNLPNSWAVAVLKLGGA
jgi:hypothetical protein